MELTRREEKLIRTLRRQERPRWRWIVLAIALGSFSSGGLSCYAFWIGLGTADNGVKLAVCFFALFWVVQVYNGLLCLGLTWNGHILNRTRRLLLKLLDGSGA